jgi:hypothetical protein
MDVAKAWTLPIKVYIMKYRNERRGAVDRREEVLKAA